MGWEEEQEEEQCVTTGQDEEEEEKRGIMVGWDVMRSSALWQGGMG